MTNCKFLLASSPPQKKRRSNFRQAGNCIFEDLLPVLNENTCPLLWISVRYTSIIPKYYMDEHDKGGPVMQIM
jgi:hypothetical protein